MKGELEMCPFCGIAREESYVEIVRDSTGDYYIECDDCGARGSEKKYRNDVIEQWNRISFIVHKFAPVIE